MRAAACQQQQQLLKLSSGLTRGFHNSSKPSSVSSSCSSKQCMQSCCTAEAAAATVSSSLQASNSTLTSLPPACQGRGDDAPPQHSASKTDEFSSDRSPTSPHTSQPSPSLLLNRVRISHRQPWQPRSCHPTTLAAPWAALATILWGPWASLATPPWVNSCRRQLPTQASCLSSTSTP